MSALLLRLLVFLAVRTHDSALIRLVLPDASHDKIDETCQQRVTHNKNDGEIHGDSFPTLRRGVSAKHGPDRVCRCLGCASMSKRQACIDVSPFDLFREVTW